MNKNMGLIDKAIRLIFALAVVVLYFTNIIDGWLAVILGIFALIFIATTFLSFCPLYTLFGINTCSVKEKEKK